MRRASTRLGGAKALGIKVSREHLLALLPDESREREEVLGLARGSPPRPKAWLAEIPTKIRRSGMRTLIAYAHRLQRR